MRMHSEVRSMHVFHHVRKVFFGNNNPSVNASKFITEAADPLRGEVRVQNFPFPLQLGACQPQDGFFVRAQLWDDSCTLSLCRDGPMAPPYRFAPAAFALF